MKFLLFFFLEREAVSIRRNGWSESTLWTTNWYRERGAQNSEKVLKNMNHILDAAPNRCDEKNKNNNKRHSEGGGARQKKYETVDDAISGAVYKWV